MKHSMLTLALSASLAVAWGCGSASSTRGSNHAGNGRDATADDENEEGDREEQAAADPDEPLPTAADQGNSEEDIAITQQIRRDIVSYVWLSFAAQQVQVITREGVVTLRGGVDSDSERNIVARLARDTAGVLRVDDRLASGEE